MALERKPQKKKSDPQYPSSDEYASERRSFLLKLGITAAGALGLTSCGMNDRGAPTGTGQNPTANPQAATGGKPMVTPVAGPDAGAAGGVRPIQLQQPVAQPQAAVPGEAPVPNAQPQVPAPGGRAPVQQPAQPQAQPMGGAGKVEPVPVAGTPREGSMGIAAGDGGCVGPREPLAQPQAQKPGEMPAPKPAAPQAAMRGRVATPDLARPQAESKGDVAAPRLANPQAEVEGGVRPAKLDPKAEGK